MAENNAPFFMYKDKPLVRKDNEIYYGYVSEGYFVMMRILEKDDLPDETKFAITLMHQKEDGGLQMLNSAQRVGTYNALELADIWLTNALESEKNN
jgi:hypothetical protein